ncbi:MAG: LptF/LptG family permease [Cytophagales bacterium]|nr:LptF/LptG family permease [Cytophagales bacterium]
MKKLDKLIYKSYLGPFVLTFFIALFILLMQFMLRYFDEIVGKGLGFAVITELFAYISVFLSPQAFPLAVLLASLMTFGSLGEHFELTAIKSSGISLIRAIRPLFVFSLLLTILVFFFNGFIVPHANKRAFSLLYDVKQKKAAMQIPEGVFYQDIGGYQIKVSKKFEGGSLKDVMIYDHSKQRGNTTVILADSGHMQTILGGAYLKLKLFDGNMYDEDVRRGRSKNYLSRNGFTELDMVFDLSGFELGSTDENLFSGSRQVQTLPELSRAIDSLERKYMDARYAAYKNYNRYFVYDAKGSGVSIPRHVLEGRNQPEMIGGGSEAEMARLEAQERGLLDTLVKKKKEDVRPVVRKLDSVDKKLREKAAWDERSFAEAQASLHRVDSMLKAKSGEDALYRDAMSKVRITLSTVKSDENAVESRLENWSKFRVERMKRYSAAFACLMMFLVGAPLGSIIKKGGMGVPILVSVVFYIFYYILSTQGEKFAKAGDISPWIGVWLANLALLPIGLFFLRQASRDARLLDTDYYKVALGRFAARMREKYNFVKKKK